MDTNTPLRQAVAETFPDTYAPDTWKSLLPAFIARHIEIYDLRAKDHQRELELWQQGDRLTPEPTHHFYPSSFALACEEQAKQEDLDFSALACCLYIAQSERAFYRDQNQQLIQFSRESNGVSLELLKICQSLEKR